MVLYCWLWRAGCISQDTYLLYVYDYGKEEDDDGGDDAEDNTCIVFQYKEEHELPAEYMLVVKFITAKGFTAYY